MARAGLVQNCHPWRGFQQRGSQSGHELVEDARALRSAKDEQMRRSIHWRGAQVKELRPHRNPRHLGIAEPLRRRREVDRCGLNSLAHQPVGHPRNGVGLESHGWNAAQNGRAHRRARSVAAHAQHRLRAKFAQVAYAGHNAYREHGESAELGMPGYLVERADFDQFQRKARGWDQARLHATGRAHEKHLRRVTRLELAGHGESGNDVSAGAAAGDENARNAKDGLRHVSSHRG